MKHWICLVIIFIGSFCCCCRAYVPPEIRQRWIDQHYTKEDALKTIEECALAGKNTKEPKDLFWAVKFIDRNANKLYSDISQRQELLDIANGSWELRLAVNSDRDEEFYPHPEFRAFAKAFCTISPDYYGKGIGTLDNGFSFVAIGGPCTQNVKQRRVFMTYEDFYINGQEVPGWDLSYYIRGWKRKGAAEESKPPLAFTVICATDKAMAVRGSKTGRFNACMKVSCTMILY
jgi:hypothetical protein